MEDAEGRTLKEIIDCMPLAVESEGSPYYGALHQAENKKFHDQLAMKVCEKLLPRVKVLLQQAEKRGGDRLSGCGRSGLFFGIWAAGAFCWMGKSLGRSKPSVSAILSPMRSDYEQPIGAPTEDGALFLQRRHILGTPLIY